ncbi:putative DNA ligase 4 [Apostichopus japonicus]|uniref:DNA ligase n=1 Tax=Stichopus japonicus TaxID=307972 RepID=A0A2G8LR61_STIJA|nr:putative DNA ligase 4 [Apostichopus japonicus]
MADQATPQEETVATYIPFAELCGFLEKVQRKQGSDNKKAIFKSFLEKWRECHTQLHKNNPNVKDSFFPAMRLILPQLERERMAYGIKEHTLAKLYIEILGLAKESTDAKKLLNYRAPTAKQEAGDFASVAYFVLRNRCPEKGSLTIKEVNDCLDAVALNNAAKKKDVVKKNLMHLLRNTSAIEQKWLIRMIMKEMKVGISQASIFAVFHSDAEDFFNVTNSLSKVCTDLADPKARLNDIAISLFSPFSPMLGMRANTNQVERHMEHKPFYIETKLDGERIQLHKDGDKFKYFSRRSHDYSSSFGESPLSGSLTPFIANCFKSDVQNCILDGEMCAYNTKTDSLISKGENFDVKALRDEEGIQVCYCVFDILMFNGEKLANRPVRERLTYLKKVFHPVPGRFQIVEQKQASTKSEVVDALNEAIDLHEEGIIIKHPDSTYRPDKRKGSGWLKIKPEYIDNLMDELDLLIVGGYFGKGSRAQMISHFMLAVAIPPREGQHPTVFQSFTKIGSGYSLKELHEYNQKLAEHWRPYKKENPPKFLQCTKEKPELYLDPSKSFIVQIKAAEINSSNAYKTGCTLRFPRLEKVRDDKEWHQCMTTEELDNLREASQGKLAARHAGMNDEGDESPKKKRVVSRANRPVAVAARFRGVDSSEVQKVSEILADKEICVVNGPPGKTKPELEKIVIELGGQIVQNPGQETLCVLADKVSLKLRNVIKSDVYDVVKASWLLECKENERYMPWLPSHMIHTSPDTKAKFAEDFDRYGDSFTQDVDPEKLKEVFQKVDSDNNEEVTPEAMAELEMKYFPQESPLGLFRLCKVYMDSCLVIGDQSTKIKDCSLDLVALEMRFYGAVTVATLEDDVTHVVLDSRDLSRVPEYRNIGRTCRTKFHVVTSDWAKDSIEAGRMKAERQYGASLPTV